MKSRLRQNLAYYGAILQPWLCVTVYLWSLEFQAVYGTGFASFLDRLADTSAILWTLVFWIGFICAGVALLGLVFSRTIVARISSFASWVGWILVTAIYFFRWLNGLPREFRSTPLLVLGAMAILFLLYWHRRRRRAGEALSIASDWGICFSYFALPILLLSACALGFKVGTYVFTQEIALAVSEEDLAPSGQRDSGPTNVIVIVADALRAQSVSAFGYRGKTTPFLERFAKSATVYLRTHTNATTTVPSMLTLLSGKHPLSNGRMTRALPIRPEPENVVKILRDSGYSTAAISSNIDASYATLGLQANLTKAEAADFNYLTLSWLRQLGIHPTRLGSRMYADLAALVPFLGYPRRTSSHGQIDETLGEARAAVARLRQPFFLSIHIHEPHEPYLSLATDATRLNEKIKSWTEPESPVRFYAHYDTEFQRTVDNYKKQYEASVRRVDAELEKFFGFLAHQPWYRHSLIVVTGDHGESFERGYLNHGEELYENSTRVPLIIRFPRQRVGFKVSALTQLADVAPTILRALLIPVPTWMDGQPLMPSKAPAGVATVAVNYPLYLEASNRYVLPTKLALWWDRYKMIVTCASGAVELYDLNSDPGERVNLAGRKVELVADLRRRLSLQLAKQTHEPKLECSAPPVDSKSS